MQLVMYLDNDYIDAAEIPEGSCRQPGYMGRLKRQLIEKNQEVLEKTTTKPEFFVTAISTNNAKLQVNA